MKDLHCHLIYGIDDGCKTLEESLKLLKKMEQAGTTEIILTPHYVEKSKYSCNNKEKVALYQDLRVKAIEAGIKIKMHLGNEIFFTPNFISLIKAREILTLDKSKYILFEFPLNNNIYQSSLEVISELVSKGLVPVLAHPERYPTFQKYPDSLEDYLRAGILMQANFTSLFGKYGRKAEKTLKYFLKKKWITFLGSDTHHEVHYDQQKLEKILLKITKDKQYVQELLEGNFDKVVNNEDIAIIR